MRLPCSSLVLAATLICACTDDEPAQTARVATFNVGLAFGYVPEASGRVQPIIDALQESGLDLVCLQELWTVQNDEGEWTDEVIAQVLDGVAQTYPHQYWARTQVPEDAPETGCGIEEADMLLACAEPACGEEPPENLSDCVLANCTAEFMATSPMCQSCLVTNLGQPLDTIVEACRGVSRGGIVYDGHNGLAIVSRHPLQETELLELEYALTARAVLRARVDLPAAGSTDVYCTHLAADLSSSIDYPADAPYTSFAEENEAQSRALLDFVDQTSGDGSVMLLGDFNHGPAGGDVTAELADSYQVIVGADYADPVADLEPLPCSYCEANALNLGDGRGGVLIDHVYLKLQGATVQDASIVFDDPLEITGADGQPTTVNLSDHYGVAVTIEG